MKNSIVCWSCLKPFLSLVVLFFGYSISSYGQLPLVSPIRQIQHEYSFSRSTASGLGWSQDTTNANPEESLPSPKSVMYKSMILPGWGQVTNRQIWKVPIVYALLGGLGYYSIYLTKKYHDYRAAYYNLNPRPPSGELPTDFRFGPTPDYIPENPNLQELKSIRNTYRNRRDLVYVGIVLAYGLNIIDAYVFAHMRSFDVSKDLSMRPRIQPSVIAQTSPGVTLSIDLITK